MKTLRFFSLSVLSAAMLGPAATLSAELAVELSGCAAIAEDRQRLQCYDAISGRLQADAQKRGDASQEAPVAAETSQAKGQDLEELPTFSGMGRPAKKRGRWLGIQPYRRNYILPVTYNDRVNRTLIDDTGESFRAENVEMKFQLSFELPVWAEILEQDLDLYFAYTQLSFFQAYNREYSSPFRDTVYEPELGLDWHPGLEFMDWRLKSLRLAFDHQSNGRAEPLSRSWNRLIGQVQVERDNLGLGLRLWQRIGEDAEDDDNPDITDFLGHGELYLGYDQGRHRYGLMLRNPLGHGAVQLGWSYLLNERMRFYLQYFNGYGESLIDYDHRVNRLGAGFLLNEWP